MVFGTISMLAVTISAASTRELDPRLRQHLQKQHDVIAKVIHAMPEPEPHKLDGSHFEALCQIRFYLRMVIQQELELKEFEKLQEALLSKSKYSTLSAYNPERNTIIKDFDKIFRKYVKAICDEHKKKNNSYVRHGEIIEHGQNNGVITKTMKNDDNSGFALEVFANVAEAKHYIKILLMIKIWRHNQLFEGPYMTSISGEWKMTFAEEKRFVDLQMVSNIVDYYWDTMKLCKKIIVLPPRLNTDPIRKKREEDENKPEKARKEDDQLKQQDSWMRKICCDALERRYNVKTVWPVKYIMGISDKNKGLEHFRVPFSTEYCAREEMIRFLSIVMMRNWKPTKKWDFDVKLEYVSSIVHDMYPRLINPSPSQEQQGIKAKIVIDPKHTTIQCRKDGENNYITPTAEEWIEKYKYKLLGKSLSRKKLFNHLMFAKCAISKPSADDIKRFKSECDEIGAADSCDLDAEFRRRR